jgi:hypothetical protein
VVFKLDAPLPDGFDEDAIEASFFAMPSVAVH